MRIGTNRRPFYRIVAVDERKKRTGGYLELLGTYNPLTKPKEINLEQAKIDAWLKKGAQPSEGFLRIIGKAPQRPPRKPKKAPKEAPATAPALAEEAPKTEEAQPAEQEVKAEETSVPEAAVEESAPEATTQTPEEIKEEAPATEEPEKSDS